MEKGKKLGPAVILALMLSLSPIAWADGQENASSLGPLDWLKAWIGELMEEFDPPAGASLGCTGTDRGCSPVDEDGPSIIPSG